MLKNVLLQNLVNATAWILLEFSQKCSLMRSLSNIIFTLRLGEHMF